MSENAKEMVDVIEMMEEYGFELKAVDKHGLIEFQ